jgi:ribosomal protein L34E
MSNLWNDAIAHRNRHAIEGTEPGAVIFHNALRRRTVGQHNAMMCFDGNSGDHIGTIQKNREYRLKHYKVTVKTPLGAYVTTECKTVKAAKQKVIDTRGAKHSVTLVWNSKKGAFA